MTIAVCGANGFIGRHLIARLLKQTSHNVLALSPNARNITTENPRLKKIDCDVFKTQKLSDYLKSCDVAYYLIHMMAQNKLDFSKAETMAAESFCQAAKNSKIKRVIFLGGLGNDNSKLSKHLASRHRTGDILRDNLAQVIEFRASMIIGPGSVSYEAVTKSVCKLLSFIFPGSLKTIIQPILLDDVLDYLVAALDLKLKNHEIIEIGGPEKLSYLSLIRRYSRWTNLFITPRQLRIIFAMLGSLANPMVVTTNRARKILPIDKYYNLLI